MIREHIEFGVLEQCMGMDNWTWTWTWTWQDIVRRARINSRSVECGYKKHKRLKQPVGLKLSLVLGYLWQFIVRIF